MRFFIFTIISFLIVFLCNISSYASDNNNYQDSITENTYKVEYPSITELEISIFNKNFSNENIYNRLSRLESSIFNQTFNDALDERVNRLKQTIKGHTAVNDGIAENHGQNYQQALEILEKAAFNSIYSNEPIETRVERLEQELFNQTSPEDPLNKRIERIAAVMDAKPTGELYRDMSVLRQYQNITKGVTVAGFLLLLIKALLL